MSDILQVETEGRVRILTLNRPAQRNAVDPALARALYNAALAFDADDTADIAILTGADGNFCAGFDLKAAAGDAGGDWIARLDIPPDWSDPIAQPLPGPMGPSRLRLTKPVIAAVEGFAVAGGLELALWCDLRVMAASAKFGVFCRRWGVPLIDGGTVRLPRLVGQGRANDLILTGRAVDQSEALAIGLADRATEDGQALHVALDLAQSLCRLPQGCMRADLLSAQMAPRDLARALTREWASAAMVQAEGQAGAARFVSGAGRGGAS